jgi:hypothetical protein
VGWGVSGGGAPPPRGGGGGGGVGVWVCVGVYMCVALVIQHAIRMCHIVVCGLPRSSISLHIIS